MGNGKVKLPPSLRGKYVSRAAFAKMQGEKQRLEKDIYLMVMGGVAISVDIQMKWIAKFEKNKKLSDMLREIARKELPNYKDNFPGPKLDSNPKAFK